MHPSMRLKVTGDTFFLSDPEGAVYFRNNRGSFRMEGSMIDRWIEQLMPMFNGEHTLHELTEGLPEAHRNRVLEIAQTLLQNGFLRDMSRDRPSRLPRKLLEQYASQIEFLDSLGGSGAWRFEKYREARVLAVGSGSMLTALTAALLASGLPKIRICSVNSNSFNRRRIRELADHAKQTDAEVDIEVLTAPIGAPIRWKDFVSSFDAILWASAEEDMNMFRIVHQACRLEKKWMMPALLIHQVGLAGPLVSAESEGSWASAWRRLHRAALARDPVQNASSATAESMLANVIVFELFKTMTGAAVSELRDSCYLLNLETLEAGRHPFFPHPAESRSSGTAKKVLHDRLIRQGPESPDDTDKLFSFFQRLTSPVTGIFHEWEEGDYVQLPVSLCRVQAADPRSDGPAELLQPVLCGGLTHEEARREAGLAGLESYVARWYEGRGLTAFGVGASVAEGAGRAIYHALQQEVNRQMAIGMPEGLRPLPNLLEDERCRFYFESLIRMGSQVIAAAGKPVYGLPACYVKCGDEWHGAAGFTQGMALQGALLKAVMSRQAEPEQRSSPKQLLQPAADAAALKYNLSSVVKVMEQHGFRADIYELAAEPFMKEELFGVYGVVLSGEGSA